VNNKRISEIPIIRNCQEQYLYEYDKKKPTNFIEKELNKIETKYANTFQKQIPLLECGIKIKLSGVEKEILYRFIASLIIRNPYEMKLLESHPILKHFRIENETEEEFRRFASRAVTIFPELSDIYKKIISSKYKTLIITDDEFCYSEKIPYLIINDELIFLAFPLSPKLLIVFSKYDYGSKERSDFALNIYCNLLTQCDYIYSKSKKSFNCK
jgi:hypothetical protein